MDGSPNSVDPRGPLTASIVSTAVENTHAINDTEEQMLVFAHQDGFKAPN
ncbi:hypothetical protein ACWEKU_12230 [Streptomyces californicus]